MLRTRVRDLRAPVGRKTLGGAVSATQHGGALGVGARVLRRYRIDLVFGHGPSPTFLATRYPDGEKVLIRVLQDPLTDQRGPLLVHLVHEAKVVMEQQPNVAQILEFGIDEATGARCLVMSYDQSATAAQIADPRGPQERTAALFLEIAAALMERHEIDRHGATLDAARGTGQGLVRRAKPKPRSSPDEQVVHARAEFVDDAPEEKRGLDRRDLYALGSFITAIVVIAAFVFSEDRAVQTIPEYQWYHVYGNDDSGAQYDEPDPTDPFGDDPDVRAARAMRITIRSSPSGAEIWSGMRNLGRTPTEIMRPSRGSEDVLRISKAGFGETSLTVSWSSPRALSVTLGGGSIGDETSKFIQDLKRANKDAVESLKDDDKKTGPAKAPSVADQALPSALPKVDGKVSDIYKDTED